MTIDTTTARASKGPRVATAANTATSAGTSTPSRGMVSSISTVPRTKLSSIVDSPPTELSHSVIPRLLSTPLLRGYQNGIESAAFGHPGLTPDGAGVYPEPTPATVSASRA